MLFRKTPAAQGFSVLSAETPQKSYGNRKEHELLVPETADRLMENFRREIAGLREFPERIPFTEEEPWRTERIHKMPVKNFLIYFWIDGAHDKVQVTAVVYGRRDQRQMLLEMEKE